MSSLLYRIVFLFYLEEAAREERILERSELQVIVLGTGADVLRSKGGGAEEGADVRVCLRDPRVSGHRIRDDGAVAGGDQGLEGVRQRPDKVGRERVSEHVGHQDLGGRGDT